MQEVISKRIRGWTKMRLSCMRIYIIRHGETAWNIKEKRFRGQLDISLSEEGMHQAELAGSALEKEHLTAIYYSPLKRCLQTAEKIKAYQEETCRFLEEPLLIDIHFGDWQGKKHSEIFKQNPELEEQWNKHPEELIFPNGESFYRVFERIDAFFKRLRQKDSSTIAIVTHRVVMNIIMLYLLGLDLRHFWDFQFDNGSISEITLEKDGKFQIIKTNDTHHLK